MSISIDIDIDIGIDIEGTVGNRLLARVNAPVNPFDGVRVSVAFKRVERALVQMVKKGKQGALILNSKMKPLANVACPYLALTVSFTPPMARVDARGKFAGCIGERAWAGLHCRFDSQRWGCGRG